MKIFQIHHSRTALPDIRDGLKPVQRRILFSMNKDGNTFDKGFRKSAKLSETLWGIIIPMATSVFMKRWCLSRNYWKLPLNARKQRKYGWRPTSGDARAEARLSQLSGELLKDIDKIPSISSGILTIQKRTHCFTSQISIYW